MEKGLADKALVLSESHNVTQIILMNGKIKAGFMFSRVGSLISQ